MFVIGVIGPSGAGKGTACKILSEMGFFHIDTDKLVSQLHPKALPLLVDAFGPEVASEGVVNKKELAKIAFSSPQKTAILNSILHPMVMQRVSELICIAEQDEFFGVTVDGAALLEANGEKICDKILCILAPKEDRLIRVKQRDHISEQAANLRFSAQKSDAYYSEHADAVLVNSTVDQLKKDLKQLIEEWKK